MNDMGGKGCIDFKKELTEERILCIIPFTSTRKRGSIVVRYPDLEGSNQEVRVYCKGAPDMLFPDTTKVISADGTVASVDDAAEISPDLA